MRALEWLRRAADDRLVAAGDPFELPHRPHTTVRSWLRERVIHDESTASFGTWDDRAGEFGIVRFGGISDIGHSRALRTFETPSGELIREWSGRELVELSEDRRVHGYWWLWPEPIRLRPWQAPATWRDLRRIAKTMGVDVDRMLRWLFRQLRGCERSSVLLLGYPIPKRIAERPSEVHWDALVLPRLDKAEGQPRGFRPNGRGWWHRDRYGKFADARALEYLFAENWHSDRLQARGRLPPAVRDRNVALLGLGALGSTVGEMLVRAGLQKIALFDDDAVEAGNITRHIATLLDVGRRKVQAVAERLRRISPGVRVAESSAKLEGQVKVVESLLEEYDVIIDCTASDSVLSLLSRAWWSIPRTFASFSLGYRGKRLFSFGVSSNRFPSEEFERGVRPWLEHESKLWRDSDEVLEGAGCWSPLFPARYDDVALAAAVCVKEVEALAAKMSKDARFRVFAQASSEDGFQGFVPEGAPPLDDGFAS